MTPTLDISRFDTLHDAFRHAVATWPDNVWLCVPPRAGRDYAADGLEMTYAEAAVRVDRLIARYRAAGYGPGHRVALQLENRPEHILHLLAASALGFSLVPVNPDYTHDEMLYQMSHSEADLAVALPHRVAELEAVAADRPEKPLPVVDGMDLPDALPAPVAAAAGTPGRHAELGLLYTSGTTGRPKGCILTNHCFLLTGHGYVETMRAGCVTLEDGQERFFNPLPLYHMNAGELMPTVTILTGNCQIIPDRFHARSWWQDAVATGATVMHHLGIIPPALMALPESPAEKQHKIKFSLGGGIEPSLHAPFEERFGITLIEAWAMTETGRCLAAATEPRHVDTRAFGRPNQFIEGKVVDENDNELPRGTPGEFVVRTPGDDPRDGFFVAYLKNPEATEEAWRGGWFHTGDTVIQRDDGMFVFVDRSKNIIRRSGENIAAAEVEACLVGDGRVATVACLAVPDDMRDEEVMACIVPTEGTAGDRALADSLMDLCLEKLAYYKPPGWWLFVDDLPTTGTQKVQKQRIFAEGTDPRASPGIIDLRDAQEAPARLTPDKREGGRDATALPNRG